MLIAAPTPVTTEQPVPHAESPETYFGASRNDYLGNGNSGRVGVQTFTLPADIEANKLYLGGRWNILPECYYGVGCQHEHLCLERRGRPFNPGPRSSRKHLGCYRV